MFDKKYKKALEILDEEIEVYDGLFHKYLSLVDTVDEKSKEWYLNKANDYCDQCIALSYLKTKIHREIGS